MTETEAIAWIHSLGNTKREYRLRDMRALLERLSHPESGIPMVHVAGTNGKGSCCASLERILRASGYKTGLYTSPYIETYHERIRVNGLPISGRSLTLLAEKVKTAVEELTAENIAVSTFEAGTAIAMCAFAEAQVDVAVVETGLGGRLDATNVISPRVTVIMPIGLDHMHILGESIAEIAWEKAGILKPGVPAVFSPQVPEAEQVLMDTARKLQVPVTHPVVRNVRDSLREVTFDLILPDRVRENLTVALAGRHQADNASAAVAAALLLKDQGFRVTEEAIREGLSKVEWPGRLEWFGNILLDGGHNEPGVASLEEYCRKFLKPEKTVLLVAMMRDKAIDRIVEQLCTVADRIVCTEPGLPRALPSGELCDRFLQKGRNAVACPDPEKALRLAENMAGDGHVLVAGSLYLVGAIRTICRRRER